MDARHAESIERAMTVLAAAALASAVGFAAVSLGVSLIPAAAAAAATLLAAARLLRSVEGGTSCFALEPFDLEPIPPAVAIDELLLTDSDRLDRPEATACEHELVLDDVLASLGEDSRVVRLFDPSAMASPGDLRVRIERHLDGFRDAAARPDASQALHDALSELRRSLH
jgi:hypothetical protein